MMKLNRKQKIEFIDYMIDKLEDIDKGMLFICNIFDAKYSNDMDDLFPELYEMIQNELKIEDVGSVALMMGQFEYDSRDNYFEIYNTCKAELLKRFKRTL